MMNFRIEKDSLGEVKVPQDKLWGPQTQRSLEHFSIGDDLFPPEMVYAYATLKKAAARVNHRLHVLDQARADLIGLVCDELLAKKHLEQFPLHIWMTGSGTQFNMNVNEVIANRACQIAGKNLGDKAFMHPNDHVNKSQSSNDSFPTAMYITAALGTKELIKALEILRDAFKFKVKQWSEIVKTGRTHMQDATPLTLGQEFSGYVGMLDENLDRLNFALHDVYKLALGGTAVGTGLNAPKGFAEAVAQEISQLTGLPFISAPNKFTVQGSHDALVHLSSSLKTLANSLYKIANDIRLLSCGPRCGFHELQIPANEPGSSIMPGKVNPTQCEALAMLCCQVMAHDMACAMGGSAGYLEMNVYKPLLIYNISKSLKLLKDGCHNFKVFLVDGMSANTKQINQYVNRSLMLVTALSPVIGYDKASQIAHYALDHDCTLKEAALKLAYISEQDFDRIVDPKKMI
jgi:fumarate hydratase class II